VATVHVELVSAETQVWSGEARSVLARTTEGELGILPGHAALLGALAEGFTVTVQEEGGGEVVAAVHGGFLSVTPDVVTVLAEVAELAGDIDPVRARAALDRARAQGDEPAARRAEGRLRAVGQSV
jgi:F-type H+-transporting ATPase subunit epsilon